MGIKIKCLETYHPRKKCDLTEFKEKFQGAEGMWASLGRNERYVVGDSGETSLTMAVEVAKQSLVKSGVSAEAINLIAFISDTPEYLIPNNAVIIRELIGASNCDLAYDLNNCCIGMVTGLDQVATYMKLNTEYKLALVVGASTLSKTAKKDCAIVGPSLGDGAACVLLEQSQEEGIIKTVYHANSMNYQRMVYPECGLTKAMCNMLDEEEKKWKFEPHDVSYFSDRWKELICKLLQSTGERLENIDQFLFSQFSYKDIQDTLDKLHIEDKESKYTFVADKYGYTANTSPFFALNEAKNLGKVKEGSKVIFCSVGAGYTMGAMLCIL